MIVETMAQWLSPWAPDLQLAHRTVADAVQIYGQQAVRDGFADLKAEHTDGKVRAMSAKAFYGFVKRSSESGKADPPAKLTARDIANQKSKDAFARAMERAVQ